MPRDEPRLAEPDPDPEPSRAGRSPAGRLLHRQRGRLAENWVPGRLRKVRIDPGRRGAVLLTVVAAVAAVIAAVGVWRERPQLQPVPVSLGPGISFGSTPPTGRSVRELSAASGSSPPATAPATAPAAATTATGGPLFVSVTGAVRNPGLVRLPGGARVADAIAAAGGVTADGTVTGLNLAQRLADGDSVVVGQGQDAPTDGSVGGGDQRPPPTGGPGAGGGAVDLNTADQQQLEDLPGVGPVMAGNIVAWRDANGPFTSIEQLQEISGIGPARFAQLAPLVKV